MVRHRNPYKKPGDQHSIRHWRIFIGDLAALCDRVLLSRGRPY